RIVDITGGRFLTPGDNPFARQGGQKGDSGETWPLYLLGILLIYLIDIAVYRGVHIPVDIRRLNIRRLRKTEIM
ncbi:MAG: hypothetical protein U0940_04030, partial [Nitrospirota bacterium]|nr:hypothetical protein [Nitrospirota bacterium]